VRQLKEALAEVRDRGYAVDEEEFAVGLRCIAVSINGSQQRVVAAISCSIPSARLDTSKALRILTLLQEGAAELSDYLVQRPKAGVQTIRPRLNGDMQHAGSVASMSSADSEVAI
jgi:hypothetical protein